MDRGKSGVLVLAAAVAAGCGTPPASAPAEGPQRYTVTAQVIESPKHGPLLCGSGLDSLPPDCTGPEIVGWDWTKVRAQTQGGTSWGEYELVGTFDGERFTLTEPAKPAPERERPRNPKPEPTAPCEEPAGGWRPVEPAKATEQAYEQLRRAAKRSPEFAGLWLDQSYLPANLSNSELERQGNDPQRFVVTIAFTGDLERHEESLREVWGGALCLTPAERTYQQLRSIQESLTDWVRESGEHWLGVGLDVMTNQAELSVYLATPELQEKLDRRHGEGAVKINSWLQSVP